MIGFLSTSLYQLALSPEASVNSSVPTFLVLGKGVDVGDFLQAKILREVESKRLLKYQAHA